MNFKVGDEVECIKDVDYKGTRGYCRVGDRAILRQCQLVSKIEMFDLEIIKGWHALHTAPIAYIHLGTYFKLVEEIKSEYKIGVRMIAHEDFRMDGIGFKRGDVAIIKTQVDDMFGCYIVNTDQKFTAFSSQLKQYFDVEAPNPCPPSLRKWLSDLQRQRT